MLVTNGSAPFPNAVFAVAKADLVARDFAIFHGALRTVSSNYGPWSTWVQTTDAPMSVTDERGHKIVLPRVGPDEFWSGVHRHFAEDDQRKWKYLAMLALRVNAEWPVECIGRAFGHPRGHVTRCLSQIRRELRGAFQVPDDPPDERRHAPNS